MAVFSWRTMDDIKNAVSTYAQRLLSGSVNIMPPDEFIAAFIEPEHVASLRQTQQLVGFVGNTLTHMKLWTSNRMLAATYCSFGGDEPPIILPRYISSGLTRHCPEDVRMRITNWLDERYRLGRMFGDAWDAIYWLNDNCGNAAAMAVMFPALPSLLKTSAPDAEGTKAKRAQRIASAKSFGTLPKLPREVKMRMMECSDLMLTVSMLEAPAYFEVKRYHARMDINTIGTTPDFIYGHFGQQKDASFF